MVSFIGMLTLVHPFATTWHFPSRGNERYEGKKQRVIYFTYHFGVFPLWWLALPPFPRLRIGGRSAQRASQQNSYHNV